jgi:5-methyltetrahydrofolate--homocysteine methyltransferase
VGFSARTERYESAGQQNGVRKRLGRELLVADGAIGTMLRAKGLPAGEPPEHWNITRPKTVQAVHKAYLAVGCDLVETNTFGANRLRLKGYALDGQVAAINRTAVQLAREAGTAGHLVAGAVGPTGWFHQGRLRGSGTAVASAFEEQISHLVQAGVDLIVIETMTHLAEARIALQATRANPATPVVVSLTFFERQGSLFTLDGVSPEEAVRELSTAHGVGCNCMDAEMAGDVLRQMREATDLPLIAQPHAGLPRSGRKKGTYPLTPEDMVRHLPSLLAFNLGILGGCCGTTPAHLKAVVRSLRHS